MLRNHLCRRDFLTSTAIGLGGIGLARAFDRVLSESVQRTVDIQDPVHQGAITVQQLVDSIIRKITGEPLKETVDTIKAGDPSQEVEGIITTFMATREVVEKTIGLKANFIITHEPTYYNHLDDVALLKEDPVQLSKQRLIEESGIAIWRFHDYCHRIRPDGILFGVLKELGWEMYADRDDWSFCTIPTMPLSEAALILRKKLKIEKIRVIGDTDMPCRRIAFSVGAAGKEVHIRLLERPDVDVLVVGEIREWETSEYVRDAVRSGMKKALVILGHAQSEEPGMKHLVEWLRPFAPGMKITHVPAGSPFRFV